LNKIHNRQQVASDTVSTETASLFKLKKTKRDTASINDSSSKSSARRESQPQAYAKRFKTIHQDET
jgi:flagellar motor switch/type III secretory pathway protein FliN